MASKKDKLLESAQRFLLKGQLDKAIKDYQQVVSLEPREVRYRQKLAELLVRDNRKEEAIAQYEDIGKHYADNSYYLKAIAVYKQIQRLAPDNPAIFLTLGSLNHKQGLIGNSLAEYGQVVARYEKEGAQKEALKVLEQMLEVDAAHVPTRLKHAELLLATGSRDASYQAFSSLLASLRAGADSAAAQDVAARMARLFPEEQENGLDQIEQRITSGDLDGAIASLQERLKRDKGSLQLWQLLCQAERGRGNRSGLGSACRQMVELFPKDATVLEGAIRCDLEAGDFQGALAQLELHLPVLIEQKALQPAEELYLAVSDKLAADPRIEAGLRRIYEAAGAWDKLNALKRSHAQSQQAAQPAADDTAAATAAAPPSAFAPAAASSGAPAAAEPPSAFGSAWAAEAPSASPAPGTAAPELASPWEEEIELDLDDDLYGTVLAATPELDMSAPEPAPAGEVETSVDFSRSLDFAEPGFPSEAAAEPEEQELESPDFSDLSPFGELPALSGGESPPRAEASAGVEPQLPEFQFPDPFASAEGEEQEAALTDWDEALPLDLSLPDAAEFDDLDLAAPDFAQPELAEPELAEPELVEGLEEPELVEGLEEPELVEELEEPEPAFAAEPSSFEVPEAAEVLKALAVPEAPAAVEVPPVLEATETPAAPAAPEPPPVGWETIYPELDVSQDAPLDLEELESHYDLGIGYKEMGLYNAAIKEFSVAAANPQRRLACLTLQAICYREKGEPDKAQDLLQRGRALQVLGAEERMSLSYELASLFESTGALEEAIALYREVLQVNPHFGDVAQKVSALTGDEALDVIELELEEYEN